MMKRFCIVLLSITLLATLLTGCSSTKSDTTDSSEGFEVRSKAVGSAYEDDIIRSKAVGSQENTDVMVDGDMGEE